MAYSTCSPSHCLPLQSSNAKFIKEELKKVSCQHMMLRYEQWRFGPLQREAGLSLGRGLPSIGAGGTQSDAAFW
jgi:hypothetical protein